MTGLYYKIDDKSFDIVLSSAVPTIDPYISYTKLTIAKHLIDCNADTNITNQQYNTVMTQILHKINMTHTQKTNKFSPFQPRYQAINSSSTLSPQDRNPFKSKFGGSGWGSSTNQSSFTTQNSNKQTTQNGFRRSPFFH